MIRPEKFLTWLECIIQYFLTEGLISKPCSRHFAELILPSTFCIHDFYFQTTSKYQFLVLQELPLVTTAQLTQAILHFTFFFFISALLFLCDYYKI